MLKNLFIRLLSLALITTPVLASSHSEAPLISRDRCADNTDVYAFRSIEPGREDYLTLIANYIPFQEPSGGPNFYQFGDDVRYEIHVDNTGDGVPNITYRFAFQTNTVNDFGIFGMANFNDDGIISSLDDIDYNRYQTYTVERIIPGVGNRSKSARTRILGLNLKTPPSNIGPQTTPDYEVNLGSQAVYGLPNGGKVFVGQRDEAFYLDLGAIFDRISLRDIDADGGVDTTQGFNVSTIAIEIPIKEVTGTQVAPTDPLDPDAVIGVWATAKRQSIRVINDDNQRTTSGEWRQVSRLGNPLVNEVLIPIAFKDRFNAVTPTDDAINASFIIDPFLARVMDDFLGIPTPLAPRFDLNFIFMTGIPVNTITGPNYTTFLSDGQPHEMLRLNVAIPPTPFASINRLGLLGGDVAGFPNGRRVHDDVTDIALRAVAGGTPFTPTFNTFPNNALGDGVGLNPEGPPLQRFPYLNSPNPGNTPRTSNQIPDSPLRDKEVRASKYPVVDKDGRFVMKKK